MLVGLEAFNKFNNVVIVRSNHDDFLDRWLKNYEFQITVMEIRVSCG